VLWDHYSEAQAAAYLGMNHDKLKKMRQRGEIRHIDLGPHMKRYLGKDIVCTILGLQGGIMKRNGEEDA
jgi:hypothetical protein